jgi:CheY-like chemotaxis protein
MLTSRLEGVIASTEPGADASRPVILVVDDDGDQRSVLADLLEDEGYEVAQAGNGRLALERLLDRERARPALILLDLGMPIMPGRELLSILTTRPELARIPVILLSGSDAERERPRYGAIAGFLQKPCSAAVLRGMVERTVESALR